MKNQKLSIRETFLSTAGKLVVVFSWEEETHSKSLKIRRNNFLGNYLSPGVSFFSLKLTENFQIENERFRISAIIDFERYEINIGLFHYKNGEADKTTGGDYSIVFKSFIGCTKDTTPDKQHAKIVS